MTVRLLECRRIDDPLESREWESLLERLDHYSFFQTPLWSDVMAKVLPSSQPYHHLFRFSDSVTAIIPLLRLQKRFGLSKLESLPWGTYGSLLSSSPIDSAHFQQMINALLSLKNPVVEMTFPPRFENADALGHDSQATVIEGSTFLLECNLSFEELQQKCFVSNVRNRIRKAQSAGVQTSWSNSPQSAEIFSRLYSVASANWEQAGTLPKSLFTRLGESESPNVRFWIAKLNQIPLAAALVLYGKNEAFYYAAVRSGDEPKLEAGKLLLHDIIRDVCERGFQYVNLGSSCGNKGVKAFKKSMGGIKTPYTRLNLRHRMIRFLRR